MIFYPTIVFIDLIAPQPIEQVTTLLTGAVGSYVANEPAPILILLPTESDCRDSLLAVEAMPIAYRCEAKVG